MDFNRFPKEVTIIEVGARDGLQNEKKSISTEKKVEFINGLLDSGITEIEITSFVRPNKIPQLSDATEVYTQLKPRIKKEKIRGICLIPNLKGMENAVGCNVKSIALFTATSNEFNKKNINATIEESKIRIKEVCQMARENSIEMRGYISTVFGCPYEGETSFKNLVDLCQFFKSEGVQEVSLGDTTGIARPKQVSQYLDDLLKEFDKDYFSMHFHDTYSLALPNTLISLEKGITRFDSSAGGLGGCPYARGATGNLATEDLVYFLQKLGVNCGVDLEKLTQASERIIEEIKKISMSKVHNTLTK
ncbi:MAG: hydroxymethylglutaryl-CoA lyase [Halobacteriovoraceae bacterium]|nr:hydroxymethylglutaryl-CoA lyase [Halobacteriovoraceae bacterium]